MAQADETIQALREALALSPDNVRLRTHLADTLLRSGRAEEAVAEYREALRRAPADDNLKVHLARAFAASGKAPEALVIVEELIRSSPAPAQAYLLHARLLLRENDPERAAREYQKALDADPTARDPEIAAELGITGESQSLDEIVDGKVRAQIGEDEPAAADIRLERPNVNFASVGGLDAVKDDIRMKIINPILHPDLYKAYAKKAGGGILMYGPPGCGKTHLARATAGEIKAAFLAVGIHDVLDMWIGQSERNLHAIFEQAREAAPCVLFFDEVDAIGASRHAMGHSAGRHVINQFLDEMDGIRQGNEGVLVLAATNAPWHVDSAFRRPGRFDRIIFVPPPDEPGREAILRVHLVNVPSRELDLAQVARKTDRFSGADLKAVVDLAIEDKLVDAMKQGTAVPLVTKDLLAAARRVRPSTREWFATARNYALYSNEGGFYDDVKPYL